MSTQSEWPEQGRSSAASAVDLKGALQKEASGDNEPTEVLITDRAGEPYLDEHGKPAVFLVLGEYSDAIKSHDRKQTQRTLRGGFRAPDAEEIRRRTAERLAVAVTGWRFAIGGRPVPFSRDNALTVFSEAPWIADQVHNAMRVRSAFFGESSSD